MTNEYTCKHYNGTHQNTHCKAGVGYREVLSEPDRMDGSAFRTPCILWDKSPTQAANPMNEKQLAEYAKRGTCAKFELPSAEELKAYRSKIDSYMEKFAKLGPALKTIRQQQKGKNWSGVIECPVCQGKLHLGHAAYNGHMRGRCETEGCVAWIE